MGQIPNLRVAAGFPAFSNTAMDMFGPVQIKLGRKTLKEAQVIIFACMTSRAIHLELVTDKTSDAFLMAFQRLPAYADTLMFAGQTVVQISWVPKAT